MKRKPSAAWLHNSHFGKAAMTRKMMEAIVASPSTTPASKALAFEIGQKASALALSLKERIDS